MLDGSPFAKRVLQIMSVRTKWFLHEHYVAIVILIFLLSIASAAILYVKGADWKITLTITGGLLSFIYFIQKQQLEEAKFVNELFVRFNQRYDSLNEKLNDIRSQEKKAKDFEPHEIFTLYDYFNLCGEEYLFHRRGYIYPEVWKSWVAGMKIFYDDKGIRELWTQDLNTDSYYGFDISREIKKWCRKTDT
jgi:hypothetical protein